MMKGKILSLVMALILMFSLNVSAAGAQTEPMGDQDQIRLQIRDRLCITDSAITMQQDRLRTQDQTRIQFPDCENHWSMEQVKNSYNWGLIEGYPDGNFGPDKNVSGVEGLMIMSRFMKCLSGIDVGNVTSGGVDWDGVPDWAKVRLQEKNALRLMTQTQYYMEPQLNRLQVAVMLAKGMALEPVDLPVSNELKFKDQNGIPEEFIGYVLALRQLGVIIGDDGYFYPARNVTRAEIATMMGRTLDILE